jgi:adenylate cyclase
MIHFSRKAIRQIVAVGLPALIATLAALSWPPEQVHPQVAATIKPLHQLEWLGYYNFFHWRGPLPIPDTSPKFIIVGYDTNTQQRLEDGTPHLWPPPRRFHAKVVDNLVKDGAKVILFDVLMANASQPADDKAFDKALSHAKNVVLACRITRGEQGNSDTKAMISPYYDDALGVDFERDTKQAFVDVIRDSDGVVRSLYPLQRFQGEWIPSLSTAAVMGLSDRPVAFSKLTSKVISAGGLPIPRTGPTITDPIDPENNMGTAYLDFAAGLANFPIVPYDQVYHNQFKPGTFTGKAVFIGVTGVELTQAQNDYFVTAYSRFNPETVGGQTSRNVYGVVVQAQMANALQNRLFIRQAAPWEIWLCVLGFGLLGTWGVHLFMNWRGPFILLVSQIGYVSLAYALFVYGRVYLPYLLPTAGLLLSTAAVAWFERSEMRRKWAGYVSPAYLEAMLREGFESQPRRYEATVIFGDIRGFTSFSEKHPPETVVRLLDKHLEKLIRIVLAADGTVDKFLGDGIMVVFGAPRPQPDAAVRAVRAAWRMREAALQPITDQGEVYTFATGFGITTGPLVAGNVGSKELASFTLIGDTVNLASRLQAVTGQPDVIIDAATYALVRDHVTVEELGELGKGVKVKGKDEYVACYAVRDWKD